MIKHIVAFNLKAEHKNKAQVIKNELESLPAKISQILSFEVGINISEAETAFDMVLLSTFRSVDDLNIYRQHPEHLKVLDIIQLYKDQSMVVDYQIK